MHHANQALLHLHTDETVFNLSVSCRFVVRTHTHTLSYCRKLSAALATEEIPGGSELSLAFLVSFSFLSCFHRETTLPTCPKTLKSTCWAGRFSGLCSNQHRGVKTALIFLKWPENTSLNVHVHANVNSNRLIMTQWRFNLFIKLSSSVLSGHNTYTNVFSFRLN